MIVLLIALALMVVFIFLMNAFDDFSSDGLHIVCFFGAGLSGLVSIVLLLGIPINRYESSQKIVTLEATRQTVIESRRQEIDPLERATLTKEVIECNKWLAGAKYANSYLWDIYVPDTVMVVNPIK